MVSLEPSRLIVEICTDAATASTAPSANSAVCWEWKLLMQLTTTAWKVRIVGIESQHLSIRDVISFLCGALGVSESRETLELAMVHLVHSVRRWGTLCGSLASHGEGAARTNGDFSPG